MSINRQIYATSLMLIASIIFFGISDIDITIQDYFFNFDTHKWLLDRDLQPYKFIFYDGIKKVLMAIALGFVVALVFFKKSKTIQRYRSGMIVVVLSAIFVTSSATILKKYTNMPCPKHEIHYGGSYPRTAVWKRYPVEYATKSKTQCWPAGHASGGFALLGLFFLFKTKKNRILILIGALSIGWTMGTYKMLIGDHFFSHTFITMVMAWLTILLCAKATQKLTKSLLTTYETANKPCSSSL